VLTIAHFTTPANLDVHQAGTAGILFAVGPAYSGVLQFDPNRNTEIVADLAERWDVSPDAKKFTFYLRKGVTWHDGTPFTSADVRFSFERIQKPPAGMVSPRRSLLENVEKIETPDAGTVVFTLKQPQASFMPTIASGYMTVLPKHVLETKGDMKQDIVGTGPFKLKRYQNNVSLEMVKNDKYFIKDRPYLDGIAFYIISDWNTRFAALKAKRVLMTNPSAIGLTTDMRQILEREMPDKITTWVHPSLSFVYLVMNMQTKPFDDVRVRKAVNLAMDRDEAINSLVSGAGTRGFMVPRGTPWAYPDDQLARAPGYGDKSKEIPDAKKLLADAGYPNGFETTVMGRAGPLFAPRAVFVADQLKKIGIKATVDIRQDAEFYDRLNKGAAPLVSQADAELFADPDVYLLQYFYSKGSKNFSFLKDAAVDAALDKQSAALDPALRVQVAKDVQARLLNELFPIAFLVEQVGQMGAWKDVRNYVPPVGVANHLQFRDVWLAQ